MKKKEHLITINLTRIANNLIANGAFLDEDNEVDMDGWTNGLADTLENIYRLDTKLTKIIKKKLSASNSSEFIEKI